MKVCFISFEYPPKVLGGLGVYAEQLTKGLTKRGIDVLTLSAGDKNDYSNQVYRIFTPDVLYWRRFFFIEKAANLFHSLNRSEKFDLVHLNGAYPIRRKFKIPTVCTFHSANFPQLIAGLQTFSSIKALEDQLSLVFRNPVGILADIFSARLSDEIICPSSSVAKELQSYCFVGSDKIRVIPNGVDLKTFDAVRAPDERLIEKYGIQKERFVLFVGRLTYLKGVNYLIEAFRLIHEEYYDIRLVIVGSGPAMPYLQSLARDMDYVLFVGRVDSPYLKKLLYENCLAVIVPSIHDTLPTVILEAMINKKPVIASNVGGIPSLVRNGKSGFLVERKDTEGISYYIKTLIQYPELGKKMGEYGRKIVEHRFSFERMITETLAVYERLLG
jgi:glycogen(starch) synthase